MYRPQTKSETLPEVQLRDKQRFDMHLNCTENTGTGDKGNKRNDKMATGG